jgi:K+-sensing histidine kinase KdpD
MGWIECFVQARIYRAAHASYVLFRTHARIVSQRTYTSAKRIHTRAPTLEMSPHMPQPHAHPPATFHLEDMSRDLNVPLKQMMGHAEYIFNQTSDPMVKYSAKMVFEKSFQMINHVRNALDLSDMASGQFQLNRASVDLSDLMRSLIHEFQNDANERHLCLKLHFDNRIPRLVLMDAKRLRLVLTHLLNDCLKYTLPNGQIQVSVVMVEPSREILFVLKNDENKPSMPNALRVFAESYAATCETVTAQLTDRLINCMGGHIQYLYSSETGQICHFSVPLHTHLKSV